jgi:hypothetical protein
MANETRKGADKAQVSQPIDEQRLRDAVAQAYENWRLQRINEAYGKIDGADYVEEVDSYKGKDGRFYDVAPYNELLQLTGAFGDEYKGGGDYGKIGVDGLVGFRPLAEGENPMAGDLALEATDQNGYVKVERAGMYNGKGGKHADGKRYLPYILANRRGSKFQRRDEKEGRPVRYYRFEGTQADRDRIQSEIEKSYADSQARKADWEANAPMEAPAVQNVPVKEFAPEAIETAKWLDKMPKRK